MNIEVLILISSGVNKLKGKQIVLRAKLFYNFQGYMWSLGVVKSYVCSSIRAIYLRVGYMFQDQKSNILSLFWYLVVYSSPYLGIL